jgi:hypothetical protein
LQGLDERHAGTPGVRHHPAECQQLRIRVEVTQPPVDDQRQRGRGGGVLAQDPPEQWRQAGAGEVGGKGPPIEKFPYVTEAHRLVPAGVIRGEYQSLVVREGALFLDDPQVDRVAVISPRQRQQEEQDECLHRLQEIRLGRQQNIVVGYRDAAAGQLPVDRHGIGHAVPWLAVLTDNRVRGSVDPEGHREWVMADQIRDIALVCPAAGVREVPHRILPGIEDHIVAYPVLDAPAQIFANCLAVDQRVVLGRR